MTSRAALLALLADGEFHSGADLAARLGVTRAAIWKQLHALARYGVRPESRRGRGYRIHPPIELLDAAHVREALSPPARARLRGLEIAWEVDSTSTRLLDAAGREDITGQVCIAEFQSAGRGRRGRHWVAPLGAGICLSIGWQYALAPSALGALSLAVGIGAAEALRAIGLDAVRLKWPNDLVAGDRKVGGILVDLRAEAAGPSVVVVGIGINVDLPDDCGREFGQPWTDVRRAGGRDLSRHTIATAVIEHLLEALDRYGREGFEPLRARWDRLDAVRDRRIRVHTHDRAAGGFARGVDADGALLVDVDGESARQRFLSGEVSVRIEP